MDLGGAGCLGTGAQISSVPMEDTPWTIPLTSL